MTGLLQVLAFAAGLAALYFGASWLVKGAARLARSWGISPLVVGLTVVAAGTSAPELVVSMLAAVREQPDVATGNIVGSNILNIGLVLGLAAAITPLRVEAALIRREVPVMIGTALLLPLLGWDGTLGRGDAAVLLVGFAAYLAATVLVARRAPAGVEAEFQGFEAARGLEPVGRAPWKDATLVAVGLAALVAGAQLLVGSAVFFARALGVPELIVGLTVVAIGTSLPELAASVVAAFRRDTDIAIGNVVGSNIFNILLIGGGTAAVHPVRVAEPLLRFEIPVMIGASVLLLPFVYTRHCLERWEGVVLVAAYTAFAVFLVI